MRHPTEGVLRRLLDEPAGVADADRAHVAGCATCLAGLTAAREDATRVGAALHAQPAPDVDAGWQRLTGSLGSSAPVAVRTAAEPRRRRVSLRSPLVAALGVSLLLVGGGVAAATDWFQVFRTEHIQAVAVPTADLVQLPDLTSFGTVETTGAGQLEPVPDAATAQDRTGLAVPQVRDLPRGVTGAPTYQVVGQLSGTFTFSAARAASAAHGPLPTMPAGLDGSSLKLVAGPGVAETWMQGGKVPTLVVARAIAPTAYSSGVPFDTMRNYLLSLPGLSPDVAAQLSSFRPDASTLPLPIPADVATSSPTQVNGQQATLVSSKDGTLNGVVWAQGGTVTLVAGSLSADEVLSVASGLQ